MQAVNEAVANGQGKMDRKCKQVKETSEKGSVGMLCGPTLTSWQCSDPGLSASGTRSSSLHSCIAPMPDSQRMLKESKSC